MSRKLANGIAGSARGALLALGWRRLTALSIGAGLINPGRQQDSSAAKGRHFPEVTAGEVQSASRGDTERRGRRGMRLLAGGIGLALAVSLVGPASAATAGTETFTVTYSAAGTPQTVYAAGVYSATGTLSAEGFRFIFPAGSVSFTVGVLEHTDSFDETTCVLRQIARGAFQVAGGTGVLAGATGSGTLVAVFTSIYRRLPAGGCSQTDMNDYGVLSLVGNLQLAGVAS